MPAEKRAVLIAGATASGKSAMALAMAREHRGVIINADALQVYRELRILTARPTAEEEAAVPHRLFGHVAADHGYSAARWLEDAAKAIHDAWRDKRLPIIVGGTGLYFKSLIQGLAEVPAIPQEIRDRWRSFEGDLHAELARRDPETAIRLQAKDRQRLTRALEVIDATGRSLVAWQCQAQSSGVLTTCPIEYHFLDIPRDELYQRADLRFERMIEAGAVHEARRLLALDPSLPAMRAIGVRELLAHLHGEHSLADAVRQAKTATRHYIKRQLTWWRGQGRTIFPPEVLAAARSLQ